MTQYVALRFLDPAVLRDPFEVVGPFSDRGRAEHFVAPLNSEAGPDEQWRIKPITDPGEWD